MRMYPVADVGVQKPDTLGTNSSPPQEGAYLIIHILNHPNKICSIYTYMSSVIHVQNVGKSPFWRCSKQKNLFLPLVFDHKTMLRDPSSKWKFSEKTRPGIGRGYELRIECSYLIMVV